MWIHEDGLRFDTENGFTMHGKSFNKKTNKISKWVVEVDKEYNAVSINSNNNTKDFTEELKKYIKSMRLKDFFD